MRLDLLILAATLSAGDAPAVPHAPSAAPRIEEADTLPTGARMVRSAARAVLSGVGLESATTTARTRAALTALRSRVRRQSDPDALRLAFRAYYNYKAAHPEDVRKPYLYYVDYGLDARTPRGYVFDMDELRVVDGPFNVAHG
ncbi:MAG TPA: hypothetical protein VK420_08555, partial [Longimicrobium sp.]|nr:hypothetical protein [Longimicrobium sp.]